MADYLLLSALQSRGVALRPGDAMNLDTALVAGIFLVPFFLAAAYASIRIASGSGFPEERPDEVPESQLEPDEPSAGDVSEDTSRAKSDLARTHPEISGQPAAVAVRPPPSPAAVRLPDGRRLVLSSAHTPEARHPESGPELTSAVAIRAVEAEPDPSRRDALDTRTFLATNGGAMHAAARDEAQQNSDLVPRQPVESLQTMPGIPSTVRSTTPQAPASTPLTSQDSATAAATLECPSCHQRVRSRSILPEAVAKCSCGSLLRVSLTRDSLRSLIVAMAEPEVSQAAWTSLLSVDTGRALVLLGELTAGLDTDSLKAAADKCREVLVARQKKGIYVSDSGSPRPPGTRDAAGPAARQDAPAPRITCSSCQVQIPVQAVLPGTGLTCTCGALVSVPTTRETVLSLLRAMEDPATSGTAWASLQAVNFAKALPLLETLTASSGDTRRAATIANCRAVLRRRQDGTSRTEAATASASPPSSGTVARVAPTAAAAPGGAEPRRTTALGIPLEVAAKGLERALALRAVVPQTVASPAESWEHNCLPPVALAVSVLVVVLWFLYCIIHAYGPQVAVGVLALLACWLLARVWRDSQSVFR